VKVASLFLFPLAGALLAGGALALAYYFGPDVARELGDAGGVGFAEGMARAQEAAARFSGPLVSGRLPRGYYQTTPLRLSRGRGRG
jgi:hypothetical protein